MHGQKKRRKRSIDGSAVAADETVAWALTSEPQWRNSGDGYKGMCIAVTIDGPARRELIIEFPYPKGKDGHPLPVPQRPQVSQAIVQTAIDQALKAGWDPSSRGKPFVFHAPSAASPN